MGFEVFRNPATASKFPLTVKFKAPDVPAAVLTVTDRVPATAAELTVKVAVSDVVLSTFTELPVTPVPLMFSVVAPLTKFVPLNVTEIPAPRLPDDGVIAVSVGGC